MMRFLNYLLCPIMVLLAVACGSSDVDETGEPTLTLETLVLSLNDNAGTTDVDVTYEGGGAIECTATSDAEWLKAEVLGNVVDISYSQNSLSTEREANIVVQYGPLSETIVATQKANDNMSFGEDEIELPAKEGIYEVTFEYDATDVKPVITDNVDWLKAEEGDDKIIITYETNDSDESRTAEISVKLGEFTAKLPVTQLPLSVITLESSDIKLTKWASDDYSVKFEYSGVDTNAPTITITPDLGWIDATVGDGALILDYDANTGATERSVVIKVAYSDDSAELNISQAPSQWSSTALRVGDPDVAWGASDPAYADLIAEWKTAGVIGGIPYIDEMEQKVLVTLSPTQDGGRMTNSADINAAIKEATDLRGGKDSKTHGVVLLKNGTYDINESVNMRKYVSIIGEDRYKVICQINPVMGSAEAKYNQVNAFQFDELDEYCGLYRLTIKGVWENNVNGDTKPFYDWNYGIGANQELNGGGDDNNNNSISVFFKDAKNCWLDGVDIINSGEFPVRIPATHITMRDLYVDGCYNKSGGAQGYFFFVKSHNLLVDSYITHIRHISIQGGEAAYNVLYNNYFEQELSYHSGDGGYNLVEGNRIELPMDMPPNGPDTYNDGGPGYTSIMGTWSSKHVNSHNPNFHYRNICSQRNYVEAAKRRDNLDKNIKDKSMTDQTILYMGPMKEKEPNPDVCFIPSTEFKEATNELNKSDLPFLVQQLSTDGYWYPKTPYEVDTSVSTFDYSRELPTPTGSLYPVILGTRP